MKVSLHSYFLLPFFLAALVPLATPALAQDNTPTITVRKSDQVNVAIESLGGTSAAAFRAVLENDLKIAGYVGLVPVEQAGFLIRGTAANNQFQATVVDRNGGTVLSKQYSGDPRSMAHQFADDLVETLTGNPGIATSKIAFISNRSGRKEVYLADYDGANLKQLTRDANISVSPSLSRDGRKLAYTGYQSGYADVYVIDIASGSRNRIIKFPGTNTGAAFSPDGGRIALTLSKDGNPELYITNASGGGARRITKTRGVESTPTWSPDGSEIIYSSDDPGAPRLFRIPASGGSPRMINTGYGYNTEPNWSPDGKKIAFNVRSGSLQVAIQELASGATRLIGAGEDPVWGPGSRHVIMSTGSALQIVDTVNGKQFPVVTNLGKVSEPTWSR